MKTPAIPTSHVIANRVDPEAGKAAKLGDSTSIGLEPAECRPIPPRRPGRFLRGSPEDGAWYRRALYRRTVALRYIVVARLPLAP